MKITRDIIGRRVRKSYWMPERWELVFEVYLDAWEGRDMKGKEFIQMLNEKDNEYAFFDPKAKKPDPGYDEEGNRLI